LFQFIEIIKFVNITYILEKLEELTEEAKYSLNKNLRHKFLVFLKNRKLDNENSQNLQKKQ